MIGQTISHYRITRELGAGGMGVVYEAVDTKLDRTVALKFLPPESTRDPDAKTRFIHEAKAASAIDHPNVCAIYEIDETDDGELFLAMACYEGETLKDRIGRGPLPLDEALDFTRQVAEGLAKAHERDIVHRDIKPANLFITNDGVVKILDFGLAKLSARTLLTNTGSTLGTAAYMSPEQAQGEEVDHRSDIFSLGVILYEMLLGVRPFKGDHEAALLYGIVHIEPKSLPEEVSIAHPLMQEIIDRALTKEKATRYQKVHELGTDLMGLLSETGQVPDSSVGAVRTSVVDSKKRGLVFVVLAVLAAVVLYYIFMNISQNQDPVDRRSIAVLPFENIVTETGYEWVGGGMREAIIGHLTKIRDLKVISNTSANLFRNTNLTFAQIAKELDVATILEASVQQTGGRMLLTIKLIDAQSDEYIWAEDYDRELKDVFAVQSEIAVKVVEQLDATLSDEVVGRIEARPTDNIEAYKLLMKSRGQWSKGTHDDRMKSISTAHQVLKMDPYYADAYAWLSNRYVLITFYGYQPPNEMMPKAKEYALKALEYDDTNITANSSLAMIEIYYDWDLMEAERIYKRIVDLNPGESTGYSGLGWVLMFMGRFDEAVSNYRIALELNPLSVGQHQNMGELLYFARRYGESIKASLKAIDMNPDYPQSHMFLGAAYHGLGMDQEAVTSLDKEQEMSGGSRPETENWIGMYYAMVGEAEKSRAVLDRLHQKSRDLWVSPVVIANIHMALGEVDLGFQWLEKAYEEHDSRLVYIMVHSAYDRVKTDPRYIQILEKAGLTSFVTTPELSSE